MARRYKEDVIRKLQILSGNQCAFPTCKQSLLEADDADTYVGQICHIKAESPKGPRYDPDQTEEERNGFENLLIMCGTHHTVIDRNAKKYTVEVLVKIKHDHEVQFRGDADANEGVVEKLLEAIPIGIRSFSRGTEYMDSQMSALLDLGPHFHGRNIRDSKLWHEGVLPEIEKFLHEATQADVPYRLHLAAHTCIGFAAGYFLDSKTGKNVVPVQSTIRGKLVWEPDLQKRFQGQLCNYANHTMTTSGEDIALVLSITHDILAQVQEHVRSHLPSVGRIMECRALPLPGPASVPDGTHAYRIAEEVAATLHTSRSAPERKGTVHIFAAAPISLIFFLGQLGRRFGRCTLYEYDFENNGPYLPSLMLPPNKG